MTYTLDNIVWFCNDSIEKTDDITQNTYFVELEIPIENNNNIEIIWGCVSKYLHKITFWCDKKKSSVDYPRHDDNNYRITKELSGTIKIEWSLNSSETPLFAGLVVRRFFNKNNLPDSIEKTIFVFSHPETKDEYEIIEYSSLSLPTCFLDGIWIKLSNEGRDVFQIWSYDDNETNSNFFPGWVGCDEWIYVKLTKETKLQIKSFYQQKLPQSVMFYTRK